MLTKNRFILAKEESVYGTDPTPTPAANAIEAINVNVSYQGDIIERDVMRSNISPLAPRIGKRWVEVTFDCELKNGGTKGTACKLGDLIEACGYSETVSAGSSVLYSPSSQSHKSVTIYVYDAVSSTSSVLHKITGARGSFSLKIEAGAIATASFTFKGKYNAPTDVAAPTAPTYEATVPPIVESSQFMLNSVSTLIAQAINVDLNNELVDEEDLNSANAIAGFLITGRKPSGTMNPEEVLVATYPFVADWVAANQRAMSVVIGATAGNIVTVSAPKVTIDSVGDGDRNGIKTQELPFRCSQNAGNDELTLNFT